MANFLRPKYEMANSFAEKAAGGLNYVYVPVGLKRDVTLWGGAELSVQFNNAGSGCAATCDEPKPRGTTYRTFTITGRFKGSTMLEARQGGPAGSVWDFVQVVVDRPVAWGRKVSHAFKTKVIEIAGRLGIEPDYLMSCMAFETGKTFSPKIKNAAGSGAVGLIQFMPTTARSLHTTTGALATMSAVTQLDYVEKYLSAAIAAHGRIRSIEDVYMSILYPAAIAQPDTYVLFRSGTTAYTQNAGLDVDKDGVITKFEGARGVRNLVTEGRGNSLYG